MATIEEVLLEQRKKSTFNIEKMTQFLFQPHELAQFRKVMGRAPIIQHDFNLFNKGRIGVVIEAIKTVPTYFNSFNWKNKYQIMFAYLSSIYQMPAGVHVAMFTFCIEMMGTDTQHEVFLKKCYNWDIIGCYAQTELGHGSDVQNLQTTATFNEKNKTFTINTPTISAAKYWPGQLGLMSNWALVFAQMIVKGVNHGVHGFLVQIRDDKHNPLPGIEVGDIGPKFGFLSKDNGYLLLNNVVIPKRNMLRKYISVSSKGQIKKKGDPKVSYATMMQIRQHISCASPKVYALAIITATRYSCWRKQFKNQNNVQQPIIEYQTQQNKITTRVAEYYAIMIGGNNIQKITAQNFRNVKEKENFSLMNETHACLCLGKAFFTDTSFNGMEVCRKACGGHGFSQYAAFPTMIFQYSSNLTMEGQNSIMFLQVARYVLKCYKYFMTGRNQQIGQSAAYIESFDYLMSLKIQQKEPPIRWSMQNIRILLAQAVCSSISKITSKIFNKPQGMTDSDAINYLVGINAHQLGVVHAAYYTYNGFKQAIEKERHQKNKQILNHVCILYGIEQILRFTHLLIEGDFISSQTVSELNEVKEHIFKILRPQLVGLVDAFGIPEKFATNALCSGNPYQNFLKLAQKCQLNIKGSESGILISKNMKQKLAMHEPKASL